MTSPRGIEDRIRWFLDHDPSGTGMCAQHTWHSLGGDQGNPPAWGCADANECVDKVRASGRYWTPQTWDGPPPRGAWVGYTYGSYGHACLSLGDGTIATTDPAGGQGMTGVEDLDYPSKWGANGWTVWTDQYNGVRFPVGVAAVHVTDQIYSNKLGYLEPTNGDTTSNSISELQNLLDIQASGWYDNATDAAVRDWQQSIGDPPDPPLESYLGPAQRERMFPSPPYTIHDTGLPSIASAAPPGPDPEPEPPDQPGVVDQIGLWKWYSGKLTNDFKVHPDGEWHRLDAEFSQPASGIAQDSEEFHFLYLRLELPEPRSAARFFQSRFIRTGGDATAYHGAWYGDEPTNSVPFYDFHMESGSGLGGHWEVRVSGGTDPVTITTRYAKTAVIYVDPVVVSVNRAIRSNHTLRALLAALGQGATDRLDRA